MKHFKKIKSAVDVNLFLSELASFKNPWDTRRAELVDVQRETLDIPLRVAILEVGKKIWDCQKTKRTDLYPLFPRLTSFLENLEKELRSELARAMIVSLRPKGTVYRHWDNGEYYRVRDRYHLVLKSEGSRMIIGDEKETFYPGELWWFDNKEYHESYNDSDEERIHVIFDMKPLSFLGRLKRCFT